jgi:hypothetical protein
VLAWHPWSPIVNWHRQEGTKFRRQGGNYVNTGLPREPVMVAVVPILTNSATQCGEPWSKVCDLRLSLLPRIFLMMQPE